MNNTNNKQDKLNKILSKLTKEELVEMIIESSNFISNFNTNLYDKYEVNIVNKYIKYDDEYIKRELKDVYEIFKDVPENYIYYFQEISDYDYDYRYDDYEIVSSSQLVEVVNKAIKLAIILFNKEEYEESSKLIKKIYELETYMFTIDDEVDDEIGLICMDYLSQSELVIDFDSLKLIYIKSTYMYNKDFSDIYRYIKLDYLKNDLNKYFDKINKTKEFYIDLLNYIVELDNENLVNYNLITDILKYLNDENLYLFLIDKYGKQFNNLYILYFEYVGINQSVNFLKYSKKALEECNDNVIKSNISLMLSNYYRLEKLYDESYAKLCESFYYNQNYYNMLPLFTDMNRFIEYMNDIDSNLDKDNKEYNLFKSFLINSNYIFDCLNEVNSYKDWNVNYNSYKVILLLLILDNNSILMKKLFDYYFYEYAQSKKEIFKIDYIKNTYELMLDWKEHIIKLVIDKQQAYNICKDVILNRVSYILNNKYNGAYPKTALLIKVLDYVGFINNFQTENYYLDYCLQNYNKYKSFKKELLMRSEYL